MSMITIIITAINVIKIMLMLLLLLITERNKNIGKIPLFRCIPYFNLDQNR